MILESAELRAELRPEAGGTVVSLRDRATGAEVLAQLPWDPVIAPFHAAPDEAAWLARWGGGWPVMFPNGGGGGTHGGAVHGFHGEGSVASWRVEEAGGASVLLARRFATVPARMTRRLRLEGRTLALEAEVLAEAPCEVVWGEHVTLGGDLLGGDLLGGDLLGGPVVLTASAARLRASADYAPPESPLRPGAEGPWPRLPGRAAGEVDLSRPQPGWSLLAALDDLGPDPWVEVAREGGPRVRLEWTADPWPLAWLWMETGGERGAPWFGRGRCLGVEPCTTWPATGIAQAARAGGRLLSLRPGEPRRAGLRLHVT